MPANLTDLQKKQIEQAEELLFEGPDKEGFAKDLYFGRFRTDSILPYPELKPGTKAAGDSMVAKTKEFCEKNIDAETIDRDAIIPDEVIEGLGRLGVLGMTIGKEHGGIGMGQFNYCRVMEIIGGHCGSTTVFVNAHHSIGLRALDLFGTEDQKDRWMVPLAKGEKIAAFALTEPLAGSDAGNVRTRAEPTDDGKGYVINGEKRWITNGGIADVLTVMARTPDRSTPDGKITAFLVTPDMEGFEVLQARMDKVGIRGTATGEMKFTDMYVPKENVLGEVGKGLKLALTVLDFGRTTFGAGCTGAAKFCIERMVARANSRAQFGKTLGEFELVRGKIAEAAADMYAMESATYHTASLIDSGAEDYMVETAMIKIFASDQLWRIVNDCLQIWGGKGFFNDQPFERMMRDARLNLIGEGANDVLRCFIASVGFRHLGKELKGDNSGFVKTWTHRASVMSESFVAPKIPVKHEHMRFFSRALSKQIGQFSWQMKLALAKHQEGILDRQYVQARLGDIATELFMASCVYSRMTSLLVNGTIPEPDKEQEFKTGRLYLRLAQMRNEKRFDALKFNLDEEMEAVADVWLKDTFDKNWVNKPEGEIDP
ncbi:MAG: acyl-CoA dehydrogenase family protein [Mariniblastus sp.]|nr:acyl-CoA dehydrogenase family protein [Mariniblastus sp.]